MNAIRALIVLSLVCLTANAERAKKAEATEETAKGRKWKRIGWLIAKGDLKKVEAQLQKNREWLKDRHVLSMVATHGNRAIIEHFYLEGADFSTTFGRGQTPLHVAAGAGNAEGIQAFLERKLDIEAEMPGNRWHPLHMAAISGQTKAIEALLDNNADVNSKAKNGTTPLLCAADRGHKDAVLLLLKYKADLNLRERRGRAAIHLAAEKGHVEVIKVLLAFGADPKDKSAGGKTPSDLTESPDVKLVLQNHRRGMKYGYDAVRKSDAEQAATMLGLAKSYARNKVYKLAERNAKAIIQDFPNTEAAAQARQLLEEIAAQGGGISSARRKLPTLFGWTVWGAEPVPAWSPDQAPTGI